MKIGFIGVGKMASAIITGLKKTDFELIISDSSLKAGQDKAEALGVAVAQSHQELVDEVDLLVLGVKPQVLASVLNPLILTKPILSMAAGTSLEYLDKLSQADLPIIRIMPRFFKVALLSAEMIKFLISFLQLPNRLRTHLEQLLKSLKKILILSPHLQGPVLLILHSLLKLCQKQD